MMPRPMLREALSGQAGAFGRAIDSLMMQRDRVIFARGARGKAAGPDDSPFLRGLRIGLALARGETITSNYLRDRFGLSRAGAVREMRHIRDALGAEAIEVKEGNRIHVRVK